MTHGSYMEAKYCAATRKPFRRLFATVGLNSTVCWMATWLRYHPQHFKGLKLMSPMM